jgi:hypothetical protein
VAGGPADAQERAVALADDEDAGRRRQLPAHDLAQRAHVAQVRRVGSRAVRLPVAPPLGLERGAVAGEQLPVLAGGHERAEAALAVVVDEDVLGDDEPQVGGTDALGPVVVLEQAGAEALVERSDAVEHVAPEGRAEHGQHRQVEDAPGVPLPAGGRGGDELAPGGPALLDLRLVAAAVRDRSDGADLGVGEVADEPGEGAWRQQGVVVQHDQHVAARLGEPGVDAAGEAEVGGGADEPHAGVGGRERRHVGARAVRRGVVDHEDLEGRGSGVAEQAGQAQSGEVQPAVARDDDADLRRARVGARDRRRLHEGAGDLQRRRRQDERTAGHRREAQVVRQRRRGGGDADRDGGGGDRLDGDGPAARRAAADACRQPEPDEQLAEHPVGVEALLGDLPGRSSLPDGVAQDGLDRAGRVLAGAPRVQADAGRQHPAEPGVLGDDGSAAGEVGGAAVAEPAAAQPHVLVLGGRELAQAAGEVGPVGVELAGAGQRRHDREAPAPQLGLLVLGAAGQGQLDAGGRDPLGQPEQARELAVLAPAVDLAGEADLAPGLAPVADRRERPPAGGGVAGQWSSTTGCRVGRKSYPTGTGSPQPARPRFSPKVKKATCGSRKARVLASPSCSRPAAAPGRSRGRRGGRSPSAPAAARCRRAG